MHFAEIAAMKQTFSVLTRTALRDIKDLMKKGILRQDTQGGRSTGYELVT